MGNLPIRRPQFDTQGFAAWLAVNGAEVRAPTNPYEVIRYLAYGRGAKKAVTHVVYAKETGLLTFTGGSAAHYHAFLDGDVLTDQRRCVVEPIGPRPKAGEHVSSGEKMRRKLLDRDGGDCWFCGNPLGNDATIEHLVPRSKGGGNKLANYALAHRACNNSAADMPLIEKIELRARLRNSKMMETNNGR